MQSAPLNAEYNAMEHCSKEDEDRCQKRADESRERLEKRMLTMQEELKRLRKQNRKLTDEINHGVGGAIYINQACHVR